VLSGTEYAMLKGVVLPSSKMKKMQKCACETNKNFKPEK
jgi:hypothetical protein